MTLQRYTLSDGEEACTPDPDGAWVLWRDVAALLVPPKRCPWWRRWYHTRLRSADAAVIWVTLIARAPTAAAARDAWDQFLARPGQGHWWCPCAEGVRQTFRAAAFRVDADETGQGGLR